MTRLFVAIDLPEEIKDTLARFVPELSGARWVPPEQLHLTLRFIGEVGPQTFTSIQAALSLLRFKEFTLALRGIGHFPPGKRPRVLWVGMEPCDTLMQLQQDLELALSEVDISPDERRFSPHVTIARLRDTPPAAVHAFEARHGNLVCAPFQVAEIILYSSVLTKQGAIHKREAAVRCLDAKA